MGWKDSLAKAKNARTETDPIRQDIVLDEDLYQVEIRRLDGLDWAAITAEAPPETETDARLGYNTRKAALIACRRHGRLLDASGNPVPVEHDEDGEIIPVDWAGIFTAISGVEVQAIAAGWWAMNMHDPNQRVQQLKKASAAGGSMS